MTLRSVQWLQLAWVVMGLCFNAISYWRIVEGIEPLAPTDPASGVVFLTACGALIVAGVGDWKRLYRFSIPPLTILLIYSGLLLHLIAYSTDNSLPAYASFTSWLIAILINFYGIVVLATGVRLAWRKKPWPPFNS